MTFGAEDYLLRFDPYRDEHDWVSEDSRDYAVRMRSTLLPDWPEELLIEWLHRHNRCIDRYAFLGFENLRFRRETWETRRIPRSEAFFDPKLFEDFQDVDRRARDPFDWLANYMMENGTWPTPVVLLENLKGAIYFPCGEQLRSPYHLIEGHRRLSFLGGLHALRKALPAHDVWVATYQAAPVSESGAG